MLSPVLRSADTPLSLFASLRDRTLTLSGALVEKFVLCRGALKHGNKKAGSNTEGWCKLVGVTLRCSNRALIAIMLDEIDCMTDCQTNLFP